MKQKLRNNRNGLEACYPTEVEFTLTEDSLLAVFTCSHSQKYSAYENYNDPLYEGDVVELFISTGEERHYFEFEVAPNNSHFLAKIENDGTSFRGELIEKDFFFSSMEKTKEGYSVSVSVPLSEIGYSKEKGLRLNAFRIETDGGEKEKHLFALTPTLGPSFHVLACLKPIELFL